MTASDPSARTARRCGSGTGQLVCSCPLNASNTPIKLRAGVADEEFAVSIGKAAHLVGRRRAAGRGRKVGLAGAEGERPAVGDGVDAHVIPVIAPIQRGINPLRAIGGQVGRIAVRPP